MWVWLSGAAVNQEFSSPHGAQLEHLNTSNIPPQFSPTSQKRTVSSTLAVSQLSLLCCFSLFSRSISHMHLHEHTQHWYIQFVFTMSWDTGTWGPVVLISLPLFLPLSLPPTILPFTSPSLLNIPLSFPPPLAFPFLHQFLSLHPLFSASLPPSTLPPSPPIGPCISAVRHCIPTCFGLDCSLQSGRCVFPQQPPDTDKAGLGNVHSPSLFFCTFLSFPQQFITKLP